tara:strand:- start:10778 stop:13138 length:2361 start_codon:yes stop_codon:yes gene_type:complete
MAITQVSNSLVKQDLTISGGTVDNTVIGSGTPAAGTFTTVAGALASTVTGTTAAASDNSTKIATTAYVTTALANLVDSAPGTLNTLNELAAALGDDASFSTTVTTSIAAKLPLAGGTLTGHTLHGDNIFSKYGTGDDFEIYFNGTHGVIRTASSSVTGNIYIQDDNNIVLGSIGGETYVNAAKDGAVTLYHNNSIKFETTSTGVTIHEDTDKTIRFTGGIGEIGSVTGFQATTTDQSSLVDFGMRATTLRFATGSAERLRILANGSVVIGGGNSFAQQGGGLLTLEGPDAAMLVLHRTADTGDQEIQFHDHGDFNSAIAGKTGGALQFRTNGNSTVAMHLDSSGNVGIGTSTTTGNSGHSNIFLGGTANIYADSAATADASLSISQNAFVDSDGSWEYRVTDEATNYYQNAGNHVWRVAASGTAGTDISWQEAMRIDSSGNVGIGTSNINALLHVGGTADAQGSQANPAIQIGSTTGYRLGMYTDAEGGYIENKNGDDGLIFKVKTVGEAMRINSNGNFLFGGITSETATYSSFVSGQQNRILELSTNAAANQGGSTIVMSNSTVNSANCGLGSLTFAARGSSASDKRGGIIGVNTTADSSSAVTAQMYFYTMNSGSLTTKMLIHPAGVVSIPNGIELGSGIDGTAANTLDDYEEGTFTPAFDGNPGGNGYHGATGGSYVKVGRKVSFNIYIAMTSWFSSSSNLVITGLPFASGTATSGSDVLYGGCFPSYITGMNGSSTIDFGHIGSQATTISLHTHTGGNLTNVTGSGHASNFSIIVNGHYFTN